LKHILKKGDKIMCAGFISLGRETSSELWSWWLTSGFHEMRGKFLLDGEILPSQK
jgi:hypothetical protein